jgi:hypothetical protein
VITLSPISPPSGREAFKRELDSPLKAAAISPPVDCVPKFVVAGMDRRIAAGRVKDVGPRGAAQIRVAASRSGELGLFTTTVSVTS